MKRFTVFVLAVAMLLTCVTGFAAKSDLAQNLGDFSQYGYGDVTPYEEPIDITLGMGIDVSKNFPEGESYENNVWSRAYADELGINLKLAFTTGDSNDKVNTLIASGDIPDMLRVDEAQLKLLSDSGLIHGGLYEIYQQYAGAGMREIIEGVGGDAAIEKVTYEGDMLAIPILNTSRGETAPALWLRTDWMNKLGLTDPQNWDEFLNILTRFTTDDPDGNGENDTFGLTFTKELWSTSYQLDGLFNVFGSFPKTNFWVNDPANEGKVIYGAFAEETRNALEIVAKMYADGIIDPEFAVNDGSAANQRVANGNVGCVIGAVWVTNSALYASVDNTPGADWHAVAIPGMDAPTTKVTGEYPFTGYMVFNKDFEHPEALIKIVNLQYKKCFSDESTQEDYDTYIESASGTSGYTPFQIYPWGIFLPAVKNEMAADEIVNMGLKSDEVDIWAKPFAKYVEAYEAGDASMWRWYRFFGPDGGHLISGQYIREDLYNMNAYYGPTTDTMGESLSLINDIVNEMFVKIIMGEADISEFDNYKAQAEALGLNDITDEVNEWLANR